MPSRNQSDEEERSRAREIALALYLILRQHEKRTAAALIKSEARTLRALKIVAAGVVAHAVATLARAAHSDESAAHSTIRRTTPILAASIERELAAQRQRSRIVARDALIKELGHTAAVTGSYELDAAAAHVTAGSYATAWGQRAIANVSRVDDGGPYRTTAQAVGEVVSESDGRLRRIAATETAHAFNDERERIFDDYGDMPGAFKVWSAVLDRRTCSECWGLDGKVIRIHESFGGDPPRHPFCRCVVVPLIVPKPQRLEDTAIDYDLFKQEMRDVIREGRAVDRQHENEPLARHAVTFVRGSQTNRTKFGRPVRSSTVLVEKYARGDYEQAKRPQIHSKVKP